MKTLIVLAMILCAANADIVFLNDAAATCPKWTCNTAPGDNCLVANGTKTAGRTITTNPCNTGKVCQFNPLDPLSDANVTEACGTAPTPKPASPAYPGEACTKDADCLQISYWDPTAKTYAPKQTCTSNLCVGNKATENCKAHSSCTVGNYCTGNATTEGACAAQLADGAACVDDYGCQNASICFNSKCTGPTTQEVGTQLQNQGQALICKTGYATQKNVCAQLIYDSSKHSTVSSGLVQCVYDSTCNYLDVTSADGKTTASVTQKCSCPANGDGQGYCPRAMSDSGNTSLVNSLTTGMLTRYNNGLHSLSRGRFGPKTAESASDNCILYYAGTISMQLYKSQQCVTNVLGFDASKCTLSSGIMKASFAILALLIAMLFN